MSSWPSGHQLRNGRYIIQDLLGEGGFGVAYLAIDTELNRNVVIKTPNKKVQSDPNFDKIQKNFAQEAQRLSKCNHPHIVKIYDIFFEGQLRCIVMEFVDGENLAERMVNQQGPLSETEALHYIRQVCDALVVVHNNGLLHRDVKPQNIILRKDNREAVLIDFGIARPFMPNAQGLLTSFCSSGYTPIEQYNPSGRHGPHSDVYSSAATLYFLLTKKVTDDAMKRAEWMRRQSDPLKPPNDFNPKLSSQVNSAILKGLALDPDERPQSVQEWLDLLPNASNRSQNSHQVPFPRSWWQKMSQTTPFPLRTLTALGLSPVLLVPLLLVNVLSASTEEFIVSAKSDPWLAGMPPKSNANFCSLPDNFSSISNSLDNSPNKIKLKKNLLIPSKYLTFNTKSKVNTRFDKTDFNDADGNEGNSKETPSGKGNNGISSIEAPNGALVGVFIGEEPPNKSQTPDTLSFNTLEEQNYHKLYPKLNQVFFIGDGKTDMDRKQRVLVPIGAKDLYLGIMDHCHWNDNRGYFKVKVTMEFLSL